MRAPCKLDKPSSQPRGLCVKDPPLRHIANPIPLRYTDPPLQPLLNDPPSTHTPPLSVPQMYPFPGELPEFSLGTRGLFRSPVSVSVTSACPREACGFCCGCFRLSVVPPSMALPDPETLKAPSSFSEHLAKRLGQKHHRSLPGTCLPCEE